MTQYFMFLFEGPCFVYILHCTDTLSSACPPYDTQDKHQAPSLELLRPINIKGWRQKRL